VTSSTCHIDLVNETAFTAHAALCASNESTGGLTVPEAIENPRAVNTMLPPNTANARVKLILTSSTAEVAGVPNQAIMSEDDWSGEKTTSPVKLTY
jgi:hypothetical protein